MIGLKTKQLRRQLNSYYIHLKKDLLTDKEDEFKISESEKIIIGVIPITVIWNEVISDNNRFKIV